jgi:hypothetical protein
MAISTTLDRSQLESIRGFFIHLQRTYPAITPFLKGFHLTIDGWRDGRDTNLWKLGPNADKWGDQEEDPAGVSFGTSSPPQMVRIAPRLPQDLDTLAQLLSAPTPPTRYLRSQKIKVAIYGFVDASGTGFGSTFLTHHTDLLFRQGVWGRDADHVSSNYKELHNLTDAVKDGLSSGDLTHSELFVFTDNSTAEGAFYRGNTDSQMLFDLVLRLRQLDMSGLIKLHIVHVAGTRMIQQGTDGLSRGDLTEGVMQGISMLLYVPLNSSAIQRSPPTLDWIRSWAPNPSIVPLTPEEWFELGHGLAGGSYNHAGLWYPTPTHETCFLWDSAPAAAPTVIDELLLSWLKLTHLEHIFICPRLLTQYWRRKLHKVADVVIEIPAGVRPFWPLSMHEPLLLGLTLRFTSCSPWQLRLSQPILDLERELRSVWCNPKLDERIVLNASRCTYLSIDAFGFRHRTLSD